MKAEGKTMKAINWRNIRRHSGDFDIIFSRSEVDIATEGLHRRGDGVRQEADA